MFVKATREQKKLRLALSGVSGAGKTFSALALASELGSKVAVIDTERGSANLYADYFTFDACQLDQHHPNRYIDTIREAGKAGYDVLVIDSLSHAWYAMLGEVGGDFRNWAKVRPLERNLVEAILAAPCHVIVTMRSKSEWVMEDYTTKAGKQSTAPKKVGTKAIQSDGIEYEFDIAGELDLNHVLSLTKSRCKALQDTKWVNPGYELATHLKTWLAEGSAAVDQSVTEFKDRQAIQLEGFKNARLAAGVEKEQAVALLRRFGVEDPKALTPEDYQACLDLLGEMKAA